MDDTSDSGQNTPPDGSVDIRKLFVGEPFFGAGINKLVFQIRVAPSSTNAAPPSSQWYIVWNRQNPDPDFDRWYVEMKTDAAGAPTFKYGKFGVALNATNPNPNANMPVEMGDADSGSYDPASGEIIITLSNDKVESPATAIHTGQHLAHINVRTFFGRPDGGAKTQNSASDITDDGDYVLVENASCAATPSPSPSPSPSASPSPSPSPSASPSPSPTAIFQFSAASYVVSSEACTAIDITVTRAGVTTTSATVDVTSTDATAKQKGDYTFVIAHLVFAPNETQKTFQALISDDGYTEGPESANLLLQNPTNGTLGAPNAATLQILDNTPETASNPIDISRTFVGQHYHDFLYRQSDQSGEDFWTNAIESCGTDTGCRQAKRVDVSTAFFLSIEFQNTGYFLIRAHKAGFGNAKSNPRYLTFLRDLREIGEGIIVGQGNWQQQLDDNKQKFLEDFVTRPEFVTQFPQGSTAGNYVDKLFQNAAASPTTSERNAAISAYGSGDLAGRTAALKSVIDSGSVFNAQYNPTFVLMQYFGYLRRNPDDLPDANFDGYDFWLNKMNSFTPAGEDARDDKVALARVRRAEMVRAFIESREYRERFFGASSGNQLAPPEAGLTTRLRNFAGVMLRYAMFGNAAG